MPKKQKTGTKGGLTKKGRRRWQLWLGQVEFQAIEDIMRAHGHEDMSEAVRFSIREQVKRDRRRKP